jgi:UPF0755 protein
MHPSQHDFYYYVAKGDGSHEFTRSLREHNAAVQAAKLRTGYFNEGVVRRHLEVIMGRKFKMITFNGGF